MILKPHIEYSYDILWYTEANWKCKMMQTTCICTFFVHVKYFVWVAATFISTSNRPKEKTFSVNIWSKELVHVTSSDVQGFP